MSSPPSPPSPAAASPPITSRALRRELVRSERRVTQRVRRIMHNVVTYLKRKRRRDGALLAGAPAAAPRPRRPRTDGDTVLHLRFVLDAGGLYHAQVLNDRRDGDAGWVVLDITDYALTVRVRKTESMARLVREAALTALDVVRVSARVDPAAGMHRRRKVYGLFHHGGARPGDEASGRRVAFLKVPAGGPLVVTFSSVQVVKTLKDDSERLASLVRELYPPPATAARMEPLAYARSRGLMVLPQQTLIECAKALGVTDHYDLRFLERAAQFGACGAARVATDARFSALVAKPRSASAPSSDLRTLLDKARQWVPDTLVLARRAKADPEAFRDMVLPFVIKPYPGAPHVPHPASAKLAAVRTGLFLPADLTHKPLRPAAAVVRVGGVAKVVAYVYDLVMYCGAAEAEAKLPGEERRGSHFVGRADTEWIKTFANRMEAAAFDGDKEWTDAQLRAALGVAKQAVWLFADPACEAAVALDARIRRMLV